MGDGRWAHSFSSPGGEGRERRPSSRVLPFVGRDAVDGTPGIDCKPHKHCSFSRSKPSQRSEWRQWFDPIRPCFTGPGLMQSFTSRLLQISEFLQVLSVLVY